MRFRAALGAVPAVIVLASLAISAPAPRSAADDHERDEKLTLERVFPKKSFWGSSARSTTFSPDGRFAAFLYRPYHERRHGYDLYILDTETGQSRRATSADRMAEYQSDAREVRDDRQKRAKRKGVTIEQLAGEQIIRLTGRGASGEWSGEADHDSGEGRIAEGECSLSLDIGSSGYLEGEIEIGLVSLPVKHGALRGSEFTAKVKADGVSGAIELTLDDGQMSGTVTFEDPEQVLDVSLAPEDAEESDSPRGILGAVAERLALGDVVLADDAEINDSENGQRSQRSPRYGGVQGYEWSPSGDEMLLFAGGDIYRLVLDREAWSAPLEAPEFPHHDDDGDDDESESESEEKAEPEAFEPIAPYTGELTRLTRTRERETDVQYLPDGSGYTFLRDGALLRVTYGDHEIVQLDPPLKDGEQMVGYSISPDQKRLVFLANRGDSFWSSGRQITIVNYRDRFAQARQVTRHMPDDPWPEAYSSIYLYDLTGHDTEEGTLERVFTRRLSGPRDIMRVPEWSPDSSRVAFAAFDQATGHVNVMEAGFVEDDDDEADEEPTGETDEAADEEKEEPAEESDEEETADFEIENAKVVYKFLHHGGPNTPGMVQPHYLADNRRMVFITELSGFRQLHLLEPRYEQLTQLTSGQYEVYPLEISEDHSTLFVTATKGDPNQEHVYKVDLEWGEMTRLTDVEGTYSSVAVSDDGSHVLANHVDFGAPSELVSVEVGEETVTTPLSDNHPREAHKLTRVSPEYFAFENRHGQTIHGHMFKPSDWTEEDERPLLIYVYGGPLGERKMAHRGSYSAPSYFFARYMAENHGYVTATIDPRGASGYGAVFEKANFERVGEPQTEDLVDGARWLVEHHGVDEKRMALHGWSFGGFQTQMVMYTEPDVFAAGMAGAGPTEWFNYNTWYTTGTIGPHKPGELNLKEFSLLPLAKNLKGRLLLVHGMEDSNVLYQDTVNVYRALLQADKEVNVELFLDPTGGHGLGGDVKTIGRYRKYEDFLIRYLGEGEAAAHDEEDDADGDSEEKQ